MRRFTFALILVVTIAMTIVTTGTVASAQSDSLTIPASTVIRGQAGDVVELGRIAVDTARAGPLCTWQATVNNQTSTHPNSDILLESNGTTLVLADVESVPNKVTSNSGSVWLAEEVVVSVRLGSEGLFSGRMVVTIDYSNCPPVTTTVPSTTEPPTVTTQEAPTTPTTQATTTAATETTVVETSTETTEDTQVEGPEASATDTSAVATTAPTTVTTATASDELPVTGSELTVPLLVAGTLILAAGLFLTSGVRHRTS